MVTKTFRAMGSEIKMIAHPTDAITDVEVDGILEQAAHGMERSEARLSRFQSKSELSYVNSHVGKWVSISREFADVLQLAADAFRRTQGKFHPAIGHIMRDLGYDKSFERVGGLSAAMTDMASALLNGAQPVVLLPNPGQLPFRLSSDLARVYLTPGYQLDLGGIAKGWIVEQAAKKIGADGLHNFIVSAGGDMVCSGNNEGIPWIVGIENPQDSETPLLTLNVESSCIATSGTYRRTWKRNGSPVHHLIDPATSLPAQTDMVSCTVVADHLYAAEVYAKTALLLGSTEAMDWLAKQPQRGWVLLKNTGEVIHSWNS